MQISNKCAKKYLKAGSNRSSFQAVVAEELLQYQVSTHVVKKYSEYNLSVQDEEGCQVPGYGLLLGCFGRG